MTLTPSFNSFSEFVHFYLDSHTVIMATCMHYKARAAHYWVMPIQFGKWTGLPAVWKWQPQLHQRHHQHQFCATMYFIFHYSPFTLLLLPPLHRSCTQHGTTWQPLSSFSWCYDDCFPTFILVVPGFHIRAWRSVGTTSNDGGAIQLSLRLLDDA